MRGQLREEVLSAHYYSEPRGGSILTEKTFEQRRQELRERVQNELNSEHSKEITDDEIEIQNLNQQEIEVKPMIDLDYDEKSKIRMIAAIIVLVGSILGIISGGILLQGNPDQLLNSSLFNEAETVDITGQVLNSEGVTIDNVSIELFEENSNIVIQTISTNKNGYFQLNNVKPDIMELKVAKSGYITIERTFNAEDGLMNPFTMEEGNSSIISKESTVKEEGGWSLEAAVALSTFLGVMTIVTGFVGVQASVEIRRAKKYRRTQYLAGISLFSRGLIWIGPILILAGMALNSLTRTQYEDYAED